MYAREVRELTTTCDLIRTLSMRRKYRSRKSQRRGLEKKEREDSPEYCHITLGEESEYQASPSFPDSLASSCSFASDSSYANITIESDNDDITSFVSESVDLNCSRN